MTGGSHGTAAAKRVGNRTPTLSSAPFASPSARRKTATEEAAESRDEDEDDEDEEEEDEEEVEDEVNAVDSCMVTISAAATR